MARQPATDLDSRTGLFAKCIEHHAGLNENGPDQLNGGVYLGLRRPQILGRHEDQVDYRAGVALLFIAGLRARPLEPNWPAGGPAESPGELHPEALTDSGLGRDRTRRAGCRRTVTSLALSVASWVPP
jgi:hypothetical protein